MGTTYGVEAGIPAETIASRIAATQRERDTPQRLVLAFTPPPRTAHVGPGATIALSTSLNARAPRDDRTARPRRALPGVRIDGPVYRRIGKAKGSSSPRLCQAWTWSESIEKRSHILPGHGPVGRGSGACRRADGYKPRLELSSWPNSLRSSGTPLLPGSGPPRDPTPVKWGVGRAGLAPSRSPLGPSGAGRESGRSGLETLIVRVMAS